MSATQGNRRVHPRYSLPAMYTTVTATRPDGRPDLAGHLYDISVAGARIELDEALEPGDRIHIDLQLPGASQRVRASARIVWVGDDLDDPGPRRMAVKFLRFDQRADHDRLSRYLDAQALRRAA